MGFFTTTEDGLEVVAFPDIPGVDINYVTKERVMGFLEDMKAKEEALDEAERKNFEQLVEGITDPYNTFLEK